MDARHARISKAVYRIRKDWRYVDFRFKLATGQGQNAFVGLGRVL
jgi:hypothetical protein